MKLIDKVELRPIAEIKPYENNPKKHPTEQIEKLVKSIKEYGFDQPIVVDKDGVIIKGHARLEASKKIGLEKVPIIKREDLDKMQARGSRLADNKVAESEWDMERLEVEFEAIEDEFTGFELDELDFEGDGEVEEDDFAEEVDEEAETITELGDVIELGRHRLVCGDSTSEEDVSKLMNGDKADMVFTDPPYGVKYTGGTTERKALEGDKNTNLYKPCIKMSGIFTKPDASLYLWHAGTKANGVLNAIENSSFCVRAQIIWNKNQAQYGALSAQYKQKHEPAFYCYKKGEVANWNGPTNEISVWDIDRATKNEFHPTQKPVKLAARAIHNHKAKIVLDLFGGSGSTLIAAEQLDRTCYMMELDEHYCDVIIRRYINYKQSEDIDIKVNGESIDYNKYIR